MSTMHPLPNGAPDILAVIGTDTALHRVTKHELAGPCPQCGGVDRFRVNTDTGRCWCRQCWGTEHWGDAYEYLQRKDGITFPEAKARLDGVTLPKPPALVAAPRQQQGSDGRGPVVMRYDYRAADGTLLYQVQRHEPGANGKRKDFTQRRPLPEGGWSDTLGDEKVTPRVLYRLPELLAAPVTTTIWLPEGEKDVDTLVEMGFVATTSPGGVQAAWRSDYTRALRGRPVVILADKDSEDKRHLSTKRVSAIRDALRPVASGVVVLDLPGEGKDITDWVAAGGTAGELRHLLATHIAAERAKAPPIFAEIGADELDRMTFPPVYFPVPGILPEGATLFAAPPKTGKSTTMLGLSVALASGGRALGMIPVEPARVLYLALEEPPRLTQKRLRMMVGQGRLPALLRMVYEGKPLDELPKAIEAYVAEYPDTKMVVVDTLAHARGAGSRARKDIQQEDYQELIPFSHLAQKLHIAIVLVTHTKKGEALDELEMVAGSYGLAGAVDNILILNRKRHESDATLSVFSRELGSEQKLALHWDPQTLSYILDGVAADVQTSRETDEVVVLLRSAQGVMATRDVAAALGLNISTATMRLRKALEAGLIVMAGYGKYTVPTVYTEKTVESVESVESTPEGPLHFQSGVRGVTPEGPDSHFESSPDPPDPTFNDTDPVSTVPEGSHQRSFNTFNTFNGFSEPLEPPSALYAFDGRPAAACRCGRRMWTTPRYETDAAWCCSNCGVEWRLPIGLEPVGEEPL